eukprot:COSAG02_NODE_406_length_22916_cov_35.137529_2_plen_123_part_00
MFVADLGGEVAMGLRRLPTLANHCAQRASCALLQGKWIEFRELTYKLRRGEFRSGRVLSWKWNSDGMVAWKPRDTRLFVEYRIACGEVTETATSATIGARTGQANAGVPAAPSLRMACLCNS